MKWSLQQYYNDLIEFKAKYSYKCDLIEVAIDKSNPIKPFILKKLSKKIDKEFDKLIRKHYFQSLKGKLSSFISIPFLSLANFDNFNYLIY